jgi:hypothetical protein
MQVNLKESEIAKAVELFLNSKGIVTQHQEVTIQFSMGKGANGLKVQIDIEPKAGEDSDTGVRLMETVQDEAEVRAGTIAAKVKEHAAQVQEKRAEAEHKEVASVTGEKPEPAVAKFGKAKTVLTHKEATEIALPIVKPVLEAIAAHDEAAAAVELPVETPAPAPEPAEEVLAVVTVTDEEKAEAQAGIAAEDQPDAGADDALVMPGDEPAAEAAPVVEDKPAASVRRPIFGGKKLAAVEAATEVEAKEPPFEGGTKAEDAAVAEELAKPATPAAGPVRRSLFKKPGA